METHVNPLSNQHSLSIYYLTSTMDVIGDEDKTGSADSSSKSSRLLPMLLNLPKDCVLFVIKILKQGQKKVASFSKLTTSCLIIQLKKLLRSWVIFLSSDLFCWHIERVGGVSAPVHPLSLSIVSLLSLTPFSVQRERHVGFLKYHFLYYLPK